MHIEFDYQGKIYKTPKLDGKTIEDVCEAIYKDFGAMDRMKFVLDDGSLMLVGETALKSGVLRFVP